MKAIRSLEEILKELRYILSRSQKRKVVVVMIVIFVGSIMETLGVSIVIPFIEAIIDPKILLQNSIIQSVMNLFKIQEAYIVWLSALLIIVVYFLKNFILLLSAYIQASFRSRTVKDISVKMLKAYFKHPYTFFFNINSGQVIRGIYDDVGGLFFILEDLFKGFAEVLTAVLIGITLFIIDPFLATGMLLLAVIVLIATVFGIKKRVGNLGVQLRDVNAELHQSVLQYVGAIKEIMVNKKEEFFVDEYSETYEKRRKIETEYSFIGACPERIIETVCICGLIVLVAIRVDMSFDVTTFISRIGAFAIAAFRILPSMSRIAGYINNLVYYKPMLRATYNNVLEADEYMQEVSEKKPDLNKPNLILKQKVDLSDICWKYGEKEILHNISLHIYRGESIAIIGASGAGKTTLADIILGVLIPQSGDIKVDGRSIYSDIADWGERISYVPQNVYLFDDTIRNNVAFGIAQEDINEEKIWGALEQAQLAEFVHNLPQKLDTIIGERGIKFSGGQRQRIAIARAVYRNPQILVLDEATSALDNDTEKAVMDAIEALHGKLTMIIVAHRLSTIKKCDRIYEVKDALIYERDRKEIREEE